MSTIPSMVNLSMDSFRLRIVNYNLGKASDDTIWVKLEHTSPSGTKSTIGNYPVVHLYNTDTTFVWVKVNSLHDIGLNKYTATIDAPNKYDELSEMNNSGTFELFIYSDDLVPVYPHEFAIVNQQNITLKASTLNPFRPAGRYGVGWREGPVGPEAM